MGIIPAVFLAALEWALRRAGRESAMWKIFHLMAGSSTGAILSGALASGMLASKVSQVYRGEGVRLFDEARNRNWWVGRPWQGKYKREAFQRVFGAYLHPGPLRSWLYSIDLY